MSIARSLPRIAAIATIAGLAASCSTLPTQPSVNAPDAQTAPEMARSAGPAKQKNRVPGPAGTVTARILGNKGGTVRAGMFTLVIPPGAYYGFATITVAQPDPSQPLVRLGITPAPMNQFKVPVQLIADLANVDPRVIPNTSVSELLVSNDWAPVAGTVPDAQAKLVSAPLAHFSTYRVEIPPPPSGTPGPAPKIGR